MTSPKVVLLGMLTKIPVGGVIWLVAHYMEGFRRLGYEPYYVEAHARTPSMFMDNDDDDATEAATFFLDRQLRRFGFGDRWAFHALHDDGAVHGPAGTHLDRLYRDAALIINLHGGTVPLDEHTATDKLIYLGTDPVEVEIEINRGEQRAIEFLDAHSAYFTWGLNHGSPDCKVPWSDRYPMVPSPPPVILDWWATGRPVGEAFTTVGNWRQQWRDIRFEGETYTWSKHVEFMKVIDLPRQVDQPLELALSSYDPEDRTMLERHGWRVIDGLSISSDADPYRSYIQASRGEFTVAKDQNVRLRSGWFSERSATYLAAGRPVVQQDTGFASHLPTGKGLLTFSTLEGAVAAIDAVNGHLAGQAAAARAIAEEHLDAERVLADLLRVVDAEVKRPSRRRDGSMPVAHFPMELDLRLRSKRPAALPDMTEAAVRSLPLPPARYRRPGGSSVVVVTWNNLLFTRLCLESVLVNTLSPELELIVVDNASSDGTVQYLRQLRLAHREVQLVLNAENRGFAAAANQGLTAARGDVLILLNNDVMVPPGWLGGLRATLVDQSVGVVGPVSNEAGNEARISTEYRSYQEFLAAAYERRTALAGVVTDMPMLTLFCAAMRRDVYETTGGLDERYTIGLFEDDDFSLAVQKAGWRTVCAEAELVHHFGEVSFGTLRRSGKWSELFERNRRLFEGKWGVAWTNHGGRADQQQIRLIEEIRSVVADSVPGGAKVAVVSRGDDRLLELPGVTAEHFPANDDAQWAGFYPASDEEAVELLRAARSNGATHLLVPAFSRWWLDYYPLFGRVLSAAGPTAATQACLLFEIPDTAFMPRPPSV